MHIAMFSNTFLPMLGGIEKSVATFAADFRKAGHRCLVVTPEMTGAEESDEETLRVPSLKNIGGSPFSLHLPIPGLITTKMDDFAPDIMHSHHPFLLGDSALRSARRLDVPLVMTYHTLWDRYADFFPGETLKNIVVRLSVEYANLCDCVVAPSGSLASMIADLGVEAPVEVIPTGIDLALFSSGSRARGRALLGARDDWHIAGYVGRVGPEKNLAWLAQSAARWCRGDPLAHLAIVGPSEAYGPALREIFEREGLADRLLLPGAFRGSALADAYAGLDLFTFTSKSDTQGIVLAEAMAAGLAIAALDAPGAREAVTDAGNGVLLPGGASQDDYASALARLFADPERRAAMGRMAARRALAYDRRLTAGRMLELYKRLIASHSLASKKRRDDGKVGALARMAGRLDAEWLLLSTKAAATVSAVAETRAARDAAP
jgi:glycosyltransferase involved in cell wall biosynthesis